MKHKIVLLALLMSVAAGTTYAKNDNGNNGNGNGNGHDESGGSSGAPLNEGIVVLLVAGVAFGAFKLIKARKVSK
ncbi:MAG: hypothetical protein H0X33_10685 [Taibaiella sp.]|nr:hypothetical protein [Taibaiella sp.]